MPPLAGKPPYATDEPDSYYESDSKNPPQRRQRQPPQPNPNDRTSNYDVYDSYFGGNDSSANRQSGAGALGLGFMTMDDDSDDEDNNVPSRKSAENPFENPFQSKHEALAAATAAKKEPKKERIPSPPLQPTIAAPQPGYAAPIATLNLAKPEPAVAPPSHPSIRRPNNLQIGTDQSIDQVPRGGPPSPHPLQPPVSPITPAFARPRPPKAEVTFSTEKGPIMRSDAEETILPRRGNRGDDFWRRFSMVAKEERGGGSSAWLRKAQNGSNRLSRWVWIIGLIIALCIAGGIGIGWYASHKNPGHQAPTAIGGSAGEAASPSSSLKAVGSGTPSVHTTVPHVSPTHTVQRRYAPRAEATALTRDEHRRVAWSLRR